MKTKIRLISAEDFSPQCSEKRSSRTLQAEDLTEQLKKDSYFASACSKPSTVFPKLYKLSQNHIKKLSSPIFYNKLCGEILDGLDGKFPSTLSLDDQGRFIVGYAQQNKALYTKKSEE